ncbi:MAG TPA: DUF3037 domain-containing protein [Solirubrobacteraceae bacterium]|nr:DUF3037 domain-containing protein [Solirubrobacteraceae bacterium]
MPVATTTDQAPFSYVILRAVPSVERGERINVGVVVFCRQRRFLGIRWKIDPGRLAALTRCVEGVADDDVAAELDGHLRALSRVADGDPGAGPLAALDQSDRFGWLAAPSSTIVQPSEVHTGLCEDPAATLEALFERLVATAPPSA